MSVISAEGAWLRGIELRVQLEEIVRACPTDGSHKKARVHMLIAMGLRSVFFMSEMIWKLARVLEIATLGASRADKK